jgi:hypothetical protein
MKKSYSNFASGLTRFLIVLAICTFLIPINSFAQQFTPVLIAKSKDTTFRMPLISADLKIKLNDQRVAFEWLLVYRNPTKEWMEGELSMPMLNNQLITGFDMNIGNVLRKGMLAEKQQAKTVYERIVSRRCDPGLLEIINGNTFKLRIFPIMGEELKTVRLSYECDYNYSGGIFSLNYPFDFIDNLKEFNIEIDAEELSGTPFIESNIDGLNFDDSKYAEKSIEKFSSKNFFKIMFRNNLEQPLTVFSEFNDEMYFSTLYKSPLKFVPKEKPEYLTLVVDASYSQRKNNSFIERHFLKEYLKRIGNAEIELVVFSLYELGRVKFKVEAGNSDEIIEYLNSIEYIGATNYGSIDISNLNSDIVIMLSNGVNNLGECDFLSAGKPVYFINSNPDFDEAYCKNISEKSGGKFINLDNNDNLYATVMSMFEKPISITNIKSSDEFSDIMISKHLEKPDIYRITGKYKSQDEKISLIFSDGTQSEIDFKDIIIKANGSVPRLWASDRVNSLILESKIDTAEIVRLSKKHSFATKLTSFIVLETARQYFDSYIDPPPDLKKEYDEEKAEYDKRVARKKKTSSQNNVIATNTRKNFGKMLLEELKFNYYDYYKDLFEYFQNNQIEENIYFDNSLSTELSEKEQTGLILPKPFFHERHKFKILSSLSFLKKGQVIDTSDSFFIPIIYNEFDSICIKLINNDSITFHYNLEKGKLNVLDLNIIDEFRNRGIGFGDVSIFAKDSLEQYIDTCYAIVNSKFTETITKHNNQIKNLLRGDNHFYVYDSDKEYNTVNLDIKAGQYNKLILDSKDVKAYLEYEVIETDSSGLGTLTGFVKDEFGNGLINALVFFPDYHNKRTFVRENSGRFVISGIEPGEYSVTFIFGGIGERKDVIINPNKTTKLGLVHLFSSSERIDELKAYSSESSIRGGRNDENSTSYIFSQENLKADIDSIFELAEKYLKTGDTSKSEIILSGIYDIDNEKASYMYKLSAYFCRVKNIELAIDAYLRSQYFNPDSVVRDFKLARIYEDCGKPDSALKLNEKLLDYSILDYTTILLDYTYAINEIERRRLFSLIHKEELNEDEKIDLLIRTESYDFLHRLRLEVLDPNKFNPNWYYDNYFGGFRLTDPIEESSFVQKQKRPGEYKLKLKFRTWNHQTEITNKYRGRVIIDRNIGSLNYSRQVIEVEADNLEKEIEIKI